MTEQEIREHFQANMLDGESVDDCGKAMIDAKECLEYIYELHQKFKESIAKELPKEKEEYEVPSLTAEPDKGFQNLVNIGHNQCLKEVLHKLGVE